ncbi:hypothetical protein PISMIDRAFT_410626 [Pisolithus microcarpus 441]|uniref:Uncharacterized protein n=1 Tax=Pisolithus microcarpus 441 TaxID=765257 RepID=A0A0C9YHC1_9AGAM|nr:hypothetical protein PISMIDRAFT_410626 [Pisolithus microcarpus 441]
MSSWESGAWSETSGDERQSASLTQCVDSISTPPHAPANLECQPPCLCTQKGLSTGTGYRFATSITCCHSGWMLAKMAYVGSVLTTDRKIIVL